MADVLSETSEQAIISAIEANPIEWFRQLIPLIPGAVLEETDEYIRFETGLPTPMLNGFMRPLMRPETAGETVRALVEGFVEREVEMSCWTGPTCRPDNLGALLEENGLHASGETPCMAMDISTLEDEQFGPDGLEISEALDRAALDDWMLLLEAGFQMPRSVNEAMRDAAWRVGVGPGSPMRHYIGRMEGRPVGCASTFYGAGVAGLYSVATVPHARGAE